MNKAYLEKWTKIPVKQITSFEFIGYDCRFRNFINESKLHIFVPAKKMYLDYDLLNDFRRDRERRVVGFTKSTYTVSPDPNVKEVEMYEDGDYFHIGCEKVEKRVFIKEFLNIKKQADAEQHNSEEGSEQTTASSNN